MAIIAEISTQFISIQVVLRSSFDGGEEEEKAEKAMSSEFLLL